ncbi:MAG TPA: hypothetical protein VHS80_15440 [Chthoniobacterales bacterium]|jgi:hypothetical protein|nr:hypothetical protein [Chthoniobacterales bacterium]
MRCLAYKYLPLHQFWAAIIIGAGTRNVEDRKRDRVEQTHILENGPAEKAAPKFFAGPTAVSGEFYGLLKRSIVGGP